MDDARTETGTRSLPGRVVGLARDTAVVALEGVRDVGTAAAGGVIDGVAGTASHALRATEGVGEDFVTLTTRFLLHAIRGVQEVTAAAGAAFLETARAGLQGSTVIGEDVGQVTKAAARGVLRGVTEVGTEVGAAARTAAIGFLHGSAEVGAEFGDLCRKGALGALRGTGEVTAELGTLAHKNIEAGTETALSLEESLKLTALSFVRGVNDVRAEGAAPRAADTQLLEAPVNGAGR